jgi:hypothetical protein
MTECAKFVRMRKLLKVPTIEDFQNYRAGHTHKKWTALPVDWRCPSCRRSRFEILTWTQTRMENGRVPTGEYKWLAPLHGHHDHRSYAGVPPRFAPTTICGDCNSADGRAKRHLRLPADFSFSPLELSLFVIGTPHNGVQFDLEVAKKVYESIAPLLPPIPPGAKRLW